MQVHDLPTLSVLSRMGAFWVLSRIASTEQLGLLHFRVPVREWHFLALSKVARNGTIGYETSKGMKHNLRIVKLTPIALSFCESCKAEFQSMQPIENDAEAEMKKVFETHTCNRAENE